MFCSVKKSNFTRYFDQILVYATWHSISTTLVLIKFPDNLIKYLLNTDLFSEMNYLEQVCMILYVNLEH